MAHSSRRQVKPRRIGIVLASGGHQALADILADLPYPFAAPVLVFPSVHDEFLEPFVDRLAARSRMPVVVAEEGQAHEPGWVYVTGTERDLIVERGHLRLVRRGAQVCNPKDLLFRSMASEWGPDAIAVALSGMGSDGARGMKEVRDAGGFTIAQDRASSLVYSTPRFAVELDAVCESLAPPEIAPRLLTLASRRRSS